MKRTIELIHTFTAILNWASERSRYAKHYGDDSTLFLAEIHAIQMIGQNPGIIMSELCEKLGVTKGRVSILVGNLEKKELVEKYKTLSNKKEVMLRLSPRGENAFLFHERREEEFIDKVQDVLTPLSDEDIKKFNDILVKIHRLLKDYD